jgi:hypothetical protein
MTARMAGHNAQAGPAAATTAVAAQQQAAALRAEVAEINLQIAERNKAIAAVLAETTGKDCGEDPIAWWNWWWREYNEMAFATTSGARSSGDVPGGDASVDTPKPEYRQDNYQYRSVGVRAPTTWVPSGPASAPPYVQGGGSGFFAGSLYSCFLRGTPVWTLRGVAPIEEIKPGDRVLAQDADSGELAYKPVLGVTVRPPCAGVTIRCGAERLTATPGHAFWVEGRGWRMAKQLAAGDRLHTPRGSLTVTGVQRVPAPEARDATMHNLVVADAGTYFVGQDPVLVHDITPHGLTTCALPGMRPGTAVAAVESAAAADAK